MNLTIEFTENELDKVALECAEKFEIDVDDIFEAYYEGELRFFPNRINAFKWINEDNFENACDELLLLDEIDLKGYDNALHHWLDNDPRVYLHEDGERVVFKYE